MVPFEKRNHCLCCCGQDSPLCNYFFVFLAAYSNQIWIQNILLAWENLLIKMAFRPPTPLFLRASDQWLKVAYFCGDSGGILFSKSGSTDWTYLLLLANVLFSVLDLDHVPDSPLHHPSGSGGWRSGPWSECRTRPVTCPHPFHYRLHHRPSEGARVVLLRGHRVRSVYCARAGGCGIETRPPAPAKLCSVVCSTSR